MEKFKIKLRISQEIYARLDTPIEREGLDAVSAELVPYLGFFMTAQGTERALHGLAHELFSNPHGVYLQIQHQIKMGKN